MKRLLTRKRWAIRTCKDPPEEYVRTFRTRLGAYWWAWRNWCRCVDVVKLEKPQPTPAPTPPSGKMVVPEAVDLMDVQDPSDSLADFNAKHNSGFSQEDVAAVMGMFMADKLAAEPI